VSPELQGKAGDMIHYLYATRGGYLYMMGRYNTPPKAEGVGEFVLSVPEKTSQAQIDTLAHKRFMDHLRRPRKANHERHHAPAHKEKELALV
jgi:carbonic anhydrase